MEADSNRAFFELTSDLLCVIGEDGYFKDVNPAWTKTLGWTKEELLSKPFIEFIHIDDHVESMKVFERKRLVDRDHPIDNRYLCKNGSFRWLRWTGSLMNEQNLRWAAAQDVTHLRREIHDQTALLESLSEGFVIRDVTGKTIRYNALVLDILDTNEEEFKTKNLKDWINESIGRDGKALPFKEHPSVVALLTSSPSRKDMGIILKNGSVRWLQMTTVPIFSEHDGKVEKILSLFQNVTEQVNTQKRLEIAVRSGKFGIWEWDIVANRAIWDDYMHEIYGISKDQPAYNKEKFLQYLVEEDREEFANKVRQAFVDQRGFSKEFRIRRPDGQIRILRAESTGFYDATGTPLKHIGVNWDVTEQREQEVKLIHASKMSSLGEMSAGIAHEINNPLAIILGKNYKIQTMIDRDTLDPTVLQKAVSAIDVTTKRIAKIIKGLRSFAREEGADPFESYDVDTLVEDVLSFCRSRFQGHHVQLDVKNEVSGKTIECHPSQMMQVLLNLLNNAFDAVESLTEKWVRLEVTSEHDFIVFRVSDSGTGVDKEFQDKMFQPFFTTKKIGKGTGLGLSISSGLVKSHGGSIEIDTGQKNTSFVVKIPKKQKG